MPKLALKTISNTTSSLTLKQKLAQKKNESAKLKLVKPVSKTKIINNKSKLESIKSASLIAADKTQFISSGSINLNLALTGKWNCGYAIGRIANIKGAYSSGKTVLGVEAVNVVHYIEGLLKGLKTAKRYNDAEAALDREFSDDLGLPEDCEFPDPPTETVEEFHQDLFDFIQRHSDCDVCIYVLDSLDALLVREEQEEIKKNLAKTKKMRLKAIGQKEEKSKKEGDGEKEEKQSGSYGAQKAKYMSKFFRDIRNKLRKTNCILIIISQLRDDLAKKYGDKSTTSAGRALGFWSTHRVDIRKFETLKKTTNSENAFGQKVLAIVEKNKVYVGGRKAHFDIVTSPAFGIDDRGSIIDFLEERGEIPYHLGKYTWNDETYTREKLIKHMFENKDDWKLLVDAAQEVWNQIEENCCVERPKNKWENVLY